MELQEAYADIRAEGAELVAISVDDLADAQRMAEHAGAEFPVLADEDTLVAQTYGVYNVLGDGVSAPATFIVDGSGDLWGAYVGDDIRDRVSAESILQALRELNGTATQGTSS